MKWVYLCKQRVFWCLHALLWICGYIILNYFNIHRCGLEESLMSVLGFCTLRTAWQLVSYITTSQPHAHLCTHKQIHALAHAHIHMQKCKLHNYKRARQLAMCVYIYIYDVLFCLFGLGRCHSSAWVDEVFTVLKTNNTAHHKQQ